LTGLQENFEAKASTESGLKRRSVRAGLDELVLWMGSGRPCMNEITS
jgi:hypothetical protein